MKKIRIIIPYFGSFPKMFPFWLQSAKDNQSIDFLLITDNNIDSEDNIQVIKMSFEDLRAKFQEKFNFQIALPTPYKLCTYRPAYGYLFEEYLSGYDFWGFGDLDLVYGDLRLFFQESVLNSFDILSGWGHLTLYRNCAFCNTFFMEKVEGFQYYKHEFRSTPNHAFDEFQHGGISDLFKHLYPDKIWDSRLFDDIRVPRLAFNFISEFHPEYSNNLIFEYNEKSLYRIYTNSLGTIVKEETLYAHFQQRGFMKIKTDNLTKYLIVPNAFIEHSPIRLKELKQFGKSQRFRRILWNLKIRIKRRIKLLLSSVLC
jgi:hypothetical protein